MQDALILILVCISTFGVIMIAFFGTQLRRARSVRLPQLPVGKRLTLRGLNRASRVTLHEQSEQEWVVTAPPTAAAHPLEPGEKLRVEVGYEQRVYWFWATVGEAQPESGHVTLRILKPIESTERRTSPRQEFTRLLPATVNNIDAWVLDLSDGGAQLLTEAELSAGDLVRLDTEGQESRLGFVLQVEPDILQAKFVSRVRLVFD